MTKHTFRLQIDKELNCGFERLKSAIDFLKLFGVFALVDIIIK